MHGLIAEYEILQPKSRTLLEFLYYLKLVILLVRYRGHSHRSLLNKAEELVIAILIIVEGDPIIWLDCNLHDWLNQRGHEVAREIFEEGNLFYDFLVRLNQ